MTPQTFRQRAGLAAVGIVILALVGCGGRPPTTQALSGLQSRVLDVTQASAQKHYAAALSELEALAAALAKAKKAGTVTSARAAGIQASIDLVRTDLQAEISAAKATPSATPQEPPAGQKDNGHTPKATPENNGNGKPGKGNDNGGPSPSAPPIPAPTVTQPPPTSGSGN